MCKNTKISASNNTANIESSSNEVSKITIKTITYKGVEYTAEWTTDGLKIPMITEIGGYSTAIFLHIPREEVIKMFKDINEELSHT